MSIVTFGEEISNSVYTPFKFEEVGASITMMLVELGSGSSVQYGDFTTFCGIKFNPDAKTEAEAIESLEPSSFIVNTVIHNLYKTGRIKFGKVYKFTYTSPQGVEFTNKAGAKARTKSKHYSVTEVTNLPPKLSEAIQEVMNSFSLSIPSEGLGLKMAEVEQPSEVAPVVAATPKPRL